MGDSLEAVIRPIIEGQIRSFCHDHPDILDGVTWYKRREDRTLTLVNSISKRIIHDLLCAENRMRLIAALVEVSTANDASGGDGDTCQCHPQAGGLAFADGSPATPTPQRVERA